jgi:hypothetical protein
MGRPPHPALDRHAGIFESYASAVLHGERLSVADPVPTAPGEPALLDFTGSVGRFLLLSPKGQLFALTGFRTSADFARLVPQICGASFHDIYPLIAGSRPSRILLVLHPGEHAHAYFLMEIETGGTRRVAKVFQEAEELVAEAVKDDLLPVILLDELQKAAAMSRRNRAPLSVRLRYLELRANLPQSWREAAKEVFLGNAAVGGDKGEILESRLVELRREINRSMLDGYLGKCIWLDARSGLLGRPAPNRDRSGFTSFVTGDPNVVSFGKSLARDADGRFAMRTNFANVVPALVKGMSWTAPTVHVYDQPFRESFGLEEYYSLYQGLRALSDVGAPVLIHRGGTLDNAIPVALLRPATGHDLFTQVCVREFPGREVVWEKPPSLPESPR